MNVVRDLRVSAGVTQSRLAELAGTSQPTIAAYEAGRKSPTLRTLSRLAGALGRDTAIIFIPALTREDRRSLFLHRAITKKLVACPDEVIGRALRNLGRMLAQHGGAHALLEEWTHILKRQVDEIVEVMVDPRLHARELRQVTPFAGALSAAERARVYSEFSRREEEM